MNEEEAGAHSGVLSCIVLAVICCARAPRGSVTGQGVVLTDLQSLLDYQ